MPSLLIIKPSRGSKRNSWRQLFKNIVDASLVARVMKFMDEDRNCTLNTVKLFNDEFSNSGGETN